tara:strand:+ start:178 stop:546 length:369 start_codon:yes stop_codon:yes gene_type:complete
MAKYTKEELKQIRINNLKKGGRVGKGRPKGSKNKVTKDKLEKLLIQYLNQDEKNQSREDIINTKLNIDTIDNNVQLKANESIEVTKKDDIEPLEKEIIAADIKENIEETKTEPKRKRFSFLS